MLMWAIECSIHFHSFRLISLALCIVDIFGKPTIQLLYGDFLENEREWSELWESQPNFVVVIRMPQHRVVHPFDHGSSHMKRARGQFRLVWFASVQLEFTSIYNASKCSLCLAFEMVMRFSFSSGVFSWCSLNGRLTMTAMFMVNG